MDISFMKGEPYMLKNFQNQSGLSLTEVLATIVLLSIVTILAWSIFFEGAQFSNKAITKNQMQQEANVILSQLSKVHKITNYYKVDINPCSFSLEYTLNSRVKKEVFDNSNLCIKLLNVPSEVNPKKTDINLELIIEDINDPTNNLKVSSLLYRLKEESP